METIARKIRAGMKRKGLVQSDLVRECQAPKNLVSDWVRGERPISATYLPRVSEALDIPVIELAPRRLLPLLRAHEAQSRQGQAA